MFNKKIAIELAVGVLVLIVLIVGATFWLENKKTEIPVINNLQSEIGGKDYYDGFRKKCNNSSCCLQSVNNAEQNNSQVFNINEVKCSDGFKSNGLECIDGYAWCEKDITVGIANPASVYCEQNGGELITREIEDEGQTNFCQFEDGSMCEEWAFMRGECQKGKSIDISNWKTYKNNKYGFEFKYPQECTLAVGDMPNPNQIASLDCHEKENFETGKIPRNASYLGYIYIYFNSKSSMDSEVESIKKSCEFDDFSIEMMEMGKNLAIFSDVCGNYYGYIPNHIIFNEKKDKTINFSGTVSLIMREKDASEIVDKIETQSIMKKTKDITKKMLNESFKWID